MYLISFVNLVDIEKWIVFWSGVQNRDRSYQADYALSLEDLTILYVQT